MSKRLRGVIALDIDELDKIAAYLTVDVAELVGGSPAPSNPDGGGVSSTPRNPQSGGGLRYLAAAA